MIAFINKINLMTQEEYNQLDYDYVLCAGSYCKKIVSAFESEVYYKLKQQRHTIIEEEQEMARLSFTEMDYESNVIEFDRYEEQYPALLRIARYKQVFRSPS